MIARSLACRWVSGFQVPWLRPENEWSDLGRGRGRPDDDTLGIPNLPLRLGSDLDEARGQRTKLNLL